MRPYRAAVRRVCRADRVSYAHALALFQSAPPARSLVSLDDADHLLSRETDAAWVADVLAAWSRRYV